MKKSQVYKRKSMVLKVMGKNPNDYKQFNRLLRIGAIIEVEILTWKKVEKGYMVENLSNK